MSTNVKMMIAALITASALGMASAAGAQAALPEFTVEGAAANEHVPLAKSTTVTPAGADYTFEVPNLLRITCTSIEITEGFIVNKTDEGTVKSLGFFGCVVKTPTGGATTCKVKGGSPSINGQIHKNPLKVTLVTGAAGQHYVTFSVDEGFEDLVELQITECSLEGKYKIGGSLVAEVLSPASGVFATSLEGQTTETIMRAAGDKILFGLREAFLNGKVDIHLASDANWTVDW